MDAAGFVLPGWMRLRGALSMVTAFQGAVVSGFVPACRCDEGDDNQGCYGKDCGGNGFVVFEIGSKNLPIEQQMQCPADDKEDAAPLMQGMDQR